MDVSLTRLLAGARDGDQAAVEQIVPMAYSELRRLAQSILRQQRPGHTLQATALVHEAYLKLLSGETPGFESRAHFFGIAARAMRQILVDHARRQNASKRGGGAARVPLEEGVAYSSEQAGEMLDLHEALEALTAVDERKARAVEMRYFGGMTAEEIAEALGVSLPTVMRDLRMAQAWLASRLGDEGRQQA